MEKENFNSMEKSFLNPMVFYAAFQHITKQIFKILDENDLKNFREVARSWKNCIDNHNFLWNKIMVENDDNKALQFARRKGHTEMVQMLIQKPSR